MTGIVEARRADLARLCARHAVKQLELFGSAASGGFDPGHSDLDFLVQFQPMTAIEHANSYFALRDGLEEMFGHAIDLVELEPIRNPYFLDAISRSRVVLYAA